MLIIRNINRHMKPTMAKKHTKSIELTPIIPLKVLPDNHCSELDGTDLSISKEYDMDSVHELDCKSEHTLRSGLSQHTFLTESTLRSVHNHTSQTGEGALGGLRRSLGRAERRRVRFAKTVCVPSEDLQRQFAHIQTAPVDDLGKIFVGRRMESFVVAVARNCIQEQQAMIRIESCNIQAAHSRLADFFEKKRRVDRKYRELLCAIDAEQRAEIKIKAGSASAEEIESIQEAYSNTRNLIQQQKIIEESELLKEYEKEIKSKL